MKKLIFLLTVWNLVLLLGACSSYQYNTTKVSSVDFSTFKTYSWMRPVDSLSKGYFNNDIARANILEVANQELERQGLRYSKEKPDVVFRYIAIVNNKSRDVYAHYGPYPWGWGYYAPWMTWYGSYFNAPYPMRVGKEKFRSGHLILEARDPQTNTVIWQARGSMEVDQPERAINRLPKLVQGVVAQYPAGSKR